ncbi:DUF1491 family protein [Zavarzinia compransoris]|uniref:DUF1491 family protein n=1 Tax=Zavarzinia marina TaxID=2911065 RepID=UPI001F17A8D9|nr:DUF1491 family protein [Zavarzinia marina]MCF4166155.1 DUF1491 family protein [Zavarzinia marina]
MTPEPRLKTRLAVQALIRALEVRGLVAVVQRKGDEDAGGLMLLVDRFAAGTRLYDRVRDGAGTLVWAPADGGAALDPMALSERLERAVRRDPDLWLVAVEDPRGLFDPMQAD